MNLVFLQYNNYYNRIIKKLNTVEEYYNTYESVIKEGVNFSPNDDVNTTLTVNWDKNWTPDYLLVENPNDNTFTRWFVIDTIRLRGQQYQMTLRHDLVADNLESILDADCFIEKAIIGENNPLIYNSENMTVNQIKTDEYTLQDPTKCAWIIGYYGDKSSDYADSKEDIIMRGEYSDTISYDYTINSSLNNWEYKNGAIVSNSYSIYSSLNCRYDADGPTAVYYTNFTEDWINTGIYNKSEFTYRDNATNYLRSKIKTTDIAKEIIQASYINANTGIYPSGGVIGSIFLNRADNIISTLHNYDTFISNTDANEIRKLNNKRVKFVNSDGNVEYYIITVTENKIDSKWIYVNKHNNISLWEHLYYGFNTYANSDAIDAVSNFYVEIAKSKLSLTFSKVRSGKYYVDMHTGRNKLRDAPYRMFCMPYAVDQAVYIQNTGSDIPLLEQNKYTSLHMAFDLAKKYHGAGQIYDIQILPYCPIFKIYPTGTLGVIDLKNDTDLFDVIYYIEGTNEPEPVGYILYPEMSSFTLNIPFNKLPLTNIKMSNETDMIRLSSPNYNGQFEFNIAKNGGLEYFNVDCTYLPYQPYIHVNPNFGGLYGTDFNDARGLICGGDFSIAMVNDAWETYQIQNKNYQNIFDREIQNMEINQKYERIGDITKIFTGGLQGASISAMMGSMGGRGGAIAGGIIGSIASTAGGIADYQINEKLRTEALDYKNDMFGYQLGNIKALPQSISRTTAFTYNNKYFPIVEYYTCKEEEKVAVANKIAYNSMTVMAIGKLKDYVGNIWQYDDIISKGYIKGSLIRLNLNNDFHILNEISNELHKGVYLQ